MAIISKQISYPWVSATTAIKQYDIRDDNLSECIYRRQQHKRRRNSVIYDV